MLVVGSVPNALGLAALDMERRSKNTRADIFKRCLLSSWKTCVFVSKRLNAPDMTTKQTNTPIVLMTANM